MKVFLLFITISFCFLSVSAQKSDSTTTHYRIRRAGLVEHYTELKSKKYVKNGLSEISANKKVIAKGIYKDDKRVGNWEFYSQKNVLYQIYNYSSQKMVFNLPNNEITYYLDSVNTNAIVIYPAKIGSVILGLNFLFKHFKPPTEIFKGEGKYNLYYIFTLNQEGKLIKYETKVASLNFNKVEEIELKKLHSEDLEFSAAQVNGKKVASTLVFETVINISNR